jgi:hypothetical protein
MLQSPQLTPLYGLVCSILQMPVAATTFVARKRLVVGRLALRWATNHISPGPLGSPPSFPRLTSSRTFLGSYIFRTAQRSCAGCWRAGRGVGRGCVGRGCGGGVRVGADLEYDAGGSAAPTSCTRHDTYGMLSTTWKAEEEEARWNCIVEKGMRSGIEGSLLKM